MAQSKCYFARYAMPIAGLPFRAAGRAGRGKLLASRLVVCPRFRVLAFAVKTYALIFLMMWIRWTLPRFRVDQMMALCWKKLIPISLFCLLCAAAWMVARMMLAAEIGPATLEHLTFWLRAAFALGIAAWLVWYFRGPIAPAEVAAEEEVIAQAGAGPQV